MHDFSILPVAKACDLDLSAERCFLALGHVDIELDVYT
jgi:hypothetical protein